MAFWYILNLYGNLRLQVQKFLRGDQFEDPQKGKMYILQLFEKNPHTLIPLQMN